MKTKAAVLLVIGMILFSAAPALAGGAWGPARRGPFVHDRRFAPQQRFWGHPPAAVYGFNSAPFHHRGFSRYPYWRQQRFFGPYYFAFQPHPLYWHYRPLSPLFSLSPFVCLQHDLAFVNQAGFVDHVGGTHQIPFESVLFFCDTPGTSCVFPGD